MTPTWIIRQYGSGQAGAEDQRDKYFGPYPTPVLAAPAAVKRQCELGVPCTVRKMPASVAHPKRVKP